MSEILSLANPISPFFPSDVINTVAERFALPEYQNVLSAPVVDESGIAVGTISRYQLNEIFIKKFGRDLFGNRFVSEFMSQEFLSVDISESLSQAAQYITQHIRQPLSEDFVFLDQNRYIGMGGVITLLSAMEAQVASSTAEVARAYTELKASQAQLIQSEKMASLGQMVAGVAHEINTPLGYVKNNIEIVHELVQQIQHSLGAHQRLVETILSPEGDELAIAERLQEVEEITGAVSPNEVFTDLASLFEDTAYGVDQISELVIGLKNFSRLDQAMTDQVSLNDCVNSSLMIAKNTLKHKVEVVKQLQDIPAISCAPSQINQVVLNLLTNASQAIETAGRILLKTWADTAWVYFSIQDTGKGMPPETVNKIFDPFFTTKPVGEGTGLGLSICYQIIQQHGGQIRVASEVGRGTRFLVALPRHQKSKAA